MTKQTQYSPEVRERAVRMVQTYQGEHPSQRAAISSISSRIGCTAEILRGWMLQAERDQDQRAGPTTDERERMKALIHRSDRGVQYVSTRCGERLATAKIAPSVGSVGDSYDNAETINGLCKAEVIHRRSWPTRRNGFTRFSTCWAGKTSRSKRSNRKYARW